MYSLKTIVHQILFFAIIYVVMFSTSDTHKKYKFYMIPFFLSVLWIVADGCPMNTYGKDGKREKDITMFVKDLLRINEKPAERIVLSLFFGSLTVAIHKLLYNV